MIRALLDTNVVLDHFLARQPFDIEALSVWRANEQGRFTGYISGITAVNLFYVARKEIGRVRMSHPLIWQYCKPHTYSNGRTTKTPSNTQARRQAEWRRS